MFRFSFKCRFGLFLTLAYNLDWVYVGFRFNLGLCSCLA